MPVIFSGTGSGPLPGGLRVSFASGERPHLFWVARGQDGFTYKILSKSTPDRRLEAIVIEEGAGPSRRTLAHVEVPRGHPAGWLERWVEMIADELMLRFVSYDLRGVETVEEWERVARRHGWLR